MNEIVKYHNDFNRIKLPSFTEQEQNLLFTIFAKIKEKGTENEIQLYPKDLQITERLVNSKQYLTDIIDSLKVKFFKADFRQIIETQTGWIDRTFNLFQTMDIHYSKRNPNDPYDGSKLFVRIDLIVNPNFAYLVNELTANFTRFELSEFISLNSKYAKTLYRLLKQFRTQGIAYFEWNEFKHIMDISESKTTGDIDKFILKPAIKELSAERNLFDQMRIPFKDLNYEKIKGKGRGRGGNVIGIRFTFLPDNKDPRFMKQAKNSLKL